MSGIVKLHKELSQKKEFQGSEVLNKYVFSILLRDQSLFEKEVEEMYKQIQTTTDLSVLRILR